MSHSVLGKSASAVPQVEGLGVALALLMSVGMESRGKNQALMPALRSSSA